MNATAANTSSLPGWFDFQVNGFAGIDFQRAELTLSQLVFAVDALVRNGVAGIYLTLITAPEADQCAQFRKIEEFRRKDPTLARIIKGYHLEGPWLRGEAGYCGAHPPTVMCAPTRASFDRLQAAAGGNIKLVTLAPEWPGSPEFIAAITGEGVQVSIGHSNASHAEIDAAVRAGARFCTHLGNGAPNLMHRHDNIIQRLLSRDDLIACFIPDGIHLPPFVLKNFYRAKPVGKVLFTTDAIAAAGAPPGRYTLAELEVVVGADGVVRGPNGGFAGSSLTPKRGVELVSQYLGVAPEESRRLWSTAAADVFGVKLD